MNPVINYLTNATPWELTAITCGVMVAGSCCIMGAYYVIGAIVHPDGIGGRDGDEDESCFLEESANVPACAPDICAWCQPGDRNASGVCPHHKTELVEQARECARQNGGVL